VVLDYADAVSKVPPFLEQVKGLAFPLVETLEIAPINASTSEPSSAATA
jgi:hypothetical protein